MRITCDERLNEFHQFSLATGIVESDTYHIGEILCQLDKSDFKKAMDVEIVVHTENKHWKVVKKEDFGYPPYIKAI